MRVEPRAEVADKVEHGRKADRIVLENGHGVLLPQALQCHQCGARQPLHALLTKNILSTITYHLKAFLLPVQRPHSLEPTLQLRWHVGGVLLIQHLEKSLGSGPPGRWLRVVWRPEAARVVLALTAARLDVPDGCLLLANLEVDDRLHYDLVEEVGEAPGAVCVAEELLLLGLPCYNLFRGHTWVELLRLGGFLLPLGIQRFPDLPLSCRLVGPGTA
mmetsp:Transcript_51362/g.109949  ORF Transcript_51362/g.109949 Transcript_51362/m.109949 type:complete len:217 (+) Transcript_51362:572-1222(+)